MTKIEATGPAALSLRDLARDSGVSPSAPQRHFPSKQDLLAALAVRGYEDIRKELSRVDIDGPVEESLTALANAYIRYVIAHPVLLQLMYSQRFDVHSELVDDAFSKAFRAIDVVLDRARARGEIVDDEKAVDTFVRVVLRGLATSFASRAIAPDNDDVVPQVIARLVAGLRPL
jgi:AcrR family transcriptional regulator